MPERLVRFRQTFFDDLDSLLPDERGSDGRPSATDFLLYELPRLRDQLASDFETNTLAVAGAEPLRVLIEAGTLVRVVAVYALISSDDSVEVIGLDLDVSGSFADDD